MFWSQPGSYLQIFLVFDWDHCKAADLDLAVVSPLRANILKEAGTTAGAAAQAAEASKHTTNDQKCTELGWSCASVAAESYGAWGMQGSPGVFRTPCLTTGCTHIKQQVQDDI